MPLPGGFPRQAFRLFRRVPGFSTAVVLTLGLGIGATTVVFSVVDAVLLHPVPYERPERLISVMGLRPERGTERISLTAADFLALRAGNRSFSQLGAFVPFGSLDLTSDGEPVRLARHLVSQGLLEALEVRPEVGRLFTVEEFRGARVALLSHKLWRSRFGGDPRIVGRGLILGGERYQVAGVLQREFRLPGGDPDLVLPLAFQPTDGTDRDSAYLGAIGRLRPGVSIAQARADLAGLARGLATRFQATNRGLEMSLLTLPESFGRQSRTALWVIFAAVGFLLLIACVNVSNLHLVRALAREPELELRAALGATAPQLFRQLLGENLLLGAMGGALGLALAEVGLHLLPDPRGIYLPTSLTVEVGGRAVLLTVLVTLAGAFLSGLLPAWRATAGERTGLGERGGTASPRHERLQQGLVVLEVALAFVLLVGAGLMARSFQSILDQDLGYAPGHVLTFDLALPASRYAGAEASEELYRQLLSRVAALSGVEAVGAAKEIPPDEPWYFHPKIEGEEVPKEVSIGWQLLTPGYLAAMRTALRAGEGIGENDRAGSRPIALLNESAVRKIFGGRAAIGRRLRFNGHVFEIVGVTQDERSPGEEPAPVAYFSYFQAPVPAALKRSLSLVVRVKGQPEDLAGPVKSILRSLDRDLPVPQLEPLEERLATALPLARSRFNSLSQGIFALLALLLAAVGIYGVLSYSVRQRTREIGVRLALGAQRAELLQQVLRRGLILALTGVACGIAGSLALTRILDSILVGVSSVDPLTFLAISAVLLAVAIVACYLPAWKASRLDPFEALRRE
jgi:putative ABC transport system permease protein